MTAAAAAAATVECVTPCLLLRLLRERLQLLQLISSEILGECLRVVIQLLCFIVLVRVLLLAVCRLHHRRRHIETVLQVTPSSSEHHEHQSGAMPLQTLSASAAAKCAHACHCSDQRSAELPPTVTVSL